MKKLFLFALALFMFVTLNAQVEFGVTAGLHALSVKPDVSWADSPDTENESGFLVGMFAEFELSDKVDLRPALLYSSIEDYGSLMIPVMAKFNVAESFYLQGGPQLNYLLDEPPIDDDEEISKFAIQIGIGGIYEINDNIDIDLRYAFGLTGFELDGDDGHDTWDGTFTPNSLTITLGYKFD